MRIYTIHIPETGPGNSITPDDDPAVDGVAVKEGFCWPALFFSFIWALWHRMWGTAAGLLVIEGTLGALSSLLLPDALTNAAISIGAALLIGGFANDLRRWHLERRGFTQRAIIFAEGAERAMRRYLNRRDPAIAGGP